MNKGKEIPDRETMDPRVLAWLQGDSLAVRLPVAGKKPSGGSAQEFVPLDRQLYKAEAPPTLAHGFGILKIGDCLHAEGEFRCGQPEDNRSLGVFHDGNEFSVLFVGGKWQSCRRIKFANGSLYEGETRLNDNLAVSGPLFLPDGQGKTSHHGGAVYEGAYELGLRHGPGKYTIADGEFGVGHWEKGKRHGEFVCTFPDGERYEGSMRDGFYHGKGTFYHKDGSVYTGELFAGLRHGRGKLVTKLSEIEGVWANDSPHGKCVARELKQTPSGTEMRIVYEGEYFNGVKHGNGIRYYLDSDEIYTGEFVNGYKQGEGLEKGPDYEYRGKFFAGLRHGRGTLTSKEGTRRVLYISGALLEKGSEPASEVKPAVSVSSVGAKRGREDDQETEMDFSARATQAAEK